MDQYLPSEYLMSNKYLTQTASRLRLCMRKQMKEDLMGFVHHGKTELLIWRTQRVRLTYGIANYLEIFVSFLDFGLFQFYVDVTFYCNIVATENNVLNSVCVYCDGRVKNSLKCIKCTMIAYSINARKQRNWKKIL